MEYVLVVVAIALVAAALVALKKHPEILARIVALEQKVAGHQPVVVNVQAPASPAAPADFSPAPPVGVPVPVEKPAAPPAPPVIVPAPVGVNTTDPTAPGFVMPANVVPPAPVVSSGPDCSGVLGPDCGQANNIVSPANPRTIAAQGKVIVTVNDTPLEGATQYPCTVIVADQSHTFSTDGARTFAPVDTPVVVTASSAVVMQFRAA